MPEEKVPDVSQTDYVQAFVDDGVSSSATVDGIEVADETAQTGEDANAGGGSGQPLALTLGLSVSGAFVGAATLLVVKQRRGKRATMAKHLQVNKLNLSFGGLETPRSECSITTDIVLHLPSIEFDDDDVETPIAVPMPADMESFRPGSMKARQEALIDYLQDSDDDSELEFGAGIASMSAAPPMPAISPVTQNIDLPDEMRTQAMSEFKLTPVVPALSADRISAIFNSSASSQRDSILASQAGIGSSRSAVIEDEVAQPLRLKKAKSKFGKEVTRVFKWMDGDGDGFVTEEEISRYLGISTTEAQALIEEAKISLYGHRGDNKLTPAEFKQLLEKNERQEEEDINSLPPRVLARYRRVFESIDIDGNGVVTAEELAKDMGVDDVQSAIDMFTNGQCSGQSELTFEDFVKVLRRAESNRAANTLVKLLEETAEGAGLANVMQGRRRSIAEANSPAAVPKVVTNIWNSMGLADDARADPNQVQSAVLAAHARLELHCSEEDLLHLVWAFSEAARESSDGLISFPVFWKVLGEMKEEEADAPMSRSYTTASFKSEFAWDSPSSTLTPQELEVYKSVFDANDQDGDGVLDISELNNLVMDMVDRRPESKLFYFQLMQQLQMSDTNEIDFEEFVVLMQEAAEVASGEIDDADWNPTQAIGALNMMKNRMSRKSKFFFRSGTGASTASSRFGAK